MSYLGRSWTSLVLLEAKKSAEVIVREQTSTSHVGGKKRNRTREVNSEGLNFLTKGADLKMRKKQGHEWKGKQLSLFPNRAITFRPSQATASGTEQHHEEASIYFSLLARNRAFTETVLEAVMSPKNLNEAYKRVRRNGGTSGVDAMEISELLEWLGRNGEALIAQVLEERYAPAQVLGVKIPKPNGGERLLGIPTVLDRLLQQAIHQQLSLLYEPLFSEHSYGFRPNRSALDGISSLPKIS